MKHLYPLLALSLMGCATVTPGTATVQVNVCGEMEDEERYHVIKSGRYWASPCKDYFKIPLREQRSVWTSDDMVFLKNLE